MIHDNRNYIPYLAGTGLLTPIGDFFGLKQYQVNFLTCQFLALLLSYPLRSVLSPLKTSSNARLAYELFVGLFLCTFCFGYQIIHLIILSTTCLLILKYYPGRHYRHLIVFAFAMLYLAVTHIHRQVYDYGGYTMDISGPLMVMVQRVTSFSFSVHDGTIPDEKLSAVQKQRAVRTFPSVLTYYSYLMFFQAIMCGPFVFYDDYMGFIHGSKGPKKPSLPATLQQQNGVDSHGSVPEQTEPAPGGVVARKLLVSVVCGLVTLALAPSYPAESLTRPSFNEMSFIGKLWHMHVVLLMARMKYYFAWTMAEAVCHNAGLGFNGYDSSGKQRWDLIDNVDIKQVELSTNLKALIDAWNMGTAKWLRFIVYDRLTKWRTTAVLCVSSVWHGFYPGYYLMFINGGILGITARKMRHHFRWYFQTSKSKRVFYDIVTFIVTRMAIAYIASSFILLEITPSLATFRSVYFWGHVVSLPPFLLLSGRKHPQKPTSNHAQMTKNHTQTITTNHAQQTTPVPDDKKSL
ncbi:lysophospholipid acyltransferase 6-like isoform X2 [Tubulanus polymorphus]|uniref:lysophospholipid acyltransferase 6-like isoform X2 n=1 Tax=Tubulanus polymorphus TaxID=672921 RepID=UPI003DA563C4